MQYCNIHTVKDHEIDKVYMQATSPVALYDEKFHANNVIDGEISVDALPFHTASGINMPWIQIQLPKQLWVKQVALHTTFPHNEYLEVQYTLVRTYIKYAKHTKCVLLDTCRRLAC